MLERYLGLLLLTIMLIVAIYYQPASSQVLAQRANTSPTSLQPIKTQSKFQEKLESQVEIIPKRVIYREDAEMEAGEEEVVNNGKNGTRTNIVKTTFYENKQYSQEIVSTEITPPHDKIILKGTKIVWKTLNTADGEIKYWKKMRVYATHYDSRCPGCNEWTAIGMRAGFGVIAVDPKVIPLRSKAYIPGYGIAVAGDTGGAIKGNIIDLGFDDAQTSGWTARFVDIYLLSIT